MYNGTDNLRDKQAYLSPATGSLDISVIRDSRPYVLITLDLGIPNFTVFSLKFPVVEDKPSTMSELVAEAVHTLLDEMSAFMISIGFEEKVIVNIYAAVLTCFKGITGEADTNKSQSAISKDPTVKTFEGTFKLPMDFINETYDKVVTASGGKQIKRPPVHRHLELTYEKPSKTTVQDARSVIRQFRNRSLKSQPSPMYVIVYDSFGKARGTIPIGPNFKNQLLNQVYKKGSSKLEFTPTIKFNNDIEMKTTNAEGIPKSIYVGDEKYTPTATVSDDMALYFSKKDEYIVKFPDGRCVAFADFPPIGQLRDENYPVPTVYTNWTMLSKEQVPESSDDNEAVDERGTEVIEGTETETNPVADLKPDDEKNEQLEEGVDDKPAGAEKTSAQDEELWNGKRVISQWRGYRIVVNSLTHPSYYTAWTEDNKRVGVLEVRDLRIKGEEFQNPRTVEVNPKYRGRGIGFALYRAMLAHLPSEYAGICSYLPDRANKRQVPKIWGRLGGQPHPENEDYIIVRKGQSKQAKSSTGKVDSLKYMEPRAGSKFKQWLQAELDAEEVKQVWKNEEDRLFYFDQWLENEQSINVQENGDVMFWQLTPLVERLIGDLPVLLYHHTAVGLLPKIKREGLRDDVKKSNPYENSGAGVYLTTESSGPAVNGYLQSAASRFSRGGGVTLIVRTHLDELEPDPDDAGLTSGQFQFVLPYVPPSDIEFPSTTRRKASAGKHAYRTNEKGYWVGAGGGASGVLPICTATGRICLAWRSSAVNQGDCWGTIGGAIQPGLSPEESAKEEMMEETGYTGNIRLISSFVFTDGSFKYFNYLGLVPTEFPFNPQEEHGWETDAIAWFTWGDLQRDMKNNSGDYHSGIIKLFKQSGDQIREICLAASNRKSEG